MQAAKEWANIKATATLPQRQAIDIPLDDAEKALVGPTGPCWWPCTNYDRQRAELTRDEEAQVKTMREQPTNVSILTIPDFVRNRLQVKYPDYDKQLMCRMQKVLLYMCHERWGDRQRAYEKYERGTNSSLAERKQRKRATQRRRPARRTGGLPQGQRQLWDYFTRPQAGRDDNGRRDRDNANENARNVRRRPDAATHAEATTQPLRVDRQSEGNQRKRRRVERSRRTPESESDERGAHGTMLTDEASTASPGGPDT